MREIEAHKLSRPNSPEPTSLFPSNWLFFFSFSFFAFAFNWFWLVRSPLTALLMHQKGRDFLSSWKKWYLLRTQPARLLRLTAASSLHVSLQKLLGGLGCAHGPDEPGVWIQNFPYLEFGENYWLLNLILILLKMKALKPVEIKAEKKCDYLKIMEKRDNGRFPSFTSWWSWRN